MKRAVLVIDDDTDIRAVLCDILSALSGYDVAEAASASEAFSILQRDGRTWVVLLDLELPDVCGEQVLRRVVAEWADRLVVIVCSAHVCAFDRLRGYGVEAIAKPFEVTTITAAVERAFRKLEAAGHRFDE